MAHDKAKDFKFVIETDEASGKHRLIGLPSEHVYVESEDIRQAAMKQFDLEEDLINRFKKSGFYEVPYNEAIDDVAKKFRAMKNGGSCDIVVEGFAQEAEKLKKEYLK